MTGKRLEYKYEHIQSETYEHSILIQYWYSHKLNMINNTEQR